MKTLNKILTLKLRIFIFVFVVTVSSINLESKITKTAKTKINKGIKSVPNDKIPICYSSTEFYLIDSSYLHNILERISEIEEVRQYSNENEGQILYCVTETENDDIYQSNSYQVKVVLETKDHYSTRFNFYIKKQSNEIKILEVVSDSLLSIEEWRNRVLRSNW